MIGKIKLLSALVFACYWLFRLRAHAQRKLPARRGSGGVAPAHHTFGVEGGKFMLDGKPFQIIAGEMHYARIPREYWRARLRMAKAMGLNTITTYVFWNFHEPQPGVYDFTGQHDVAEFVREAQSEGLLVNLRPGPLLLRGVGVGRISGMAAEGPRHRGAQRRSQVHGAGAALAAAPGQGTCAPAARQWRPDHHGAGGERVRLIRQRPQLHGTDSSGHCGCGIRQVADLHRGWAGANPERLAAGIAGWHQLCARQCAARLLRRCTSCAPKARSWPPSGGTDGSITGAESTTRPTPRRRPMSCNGFSSRATRSAFTWCTAEPALAG